MLSVTFLGTASVLPETGGDTICHVVNDRILFDTGWSAPARMPIFGIDPLGLTHLLFTHFHHDHYVALPQVFFQRGLMKGRNSDLPPLIVGGPAEDLERIIDLTRHFMQEDRYPGALGNPELLPLQPGDRFAIGDLAVTVGRSSHTVPALGYRIEDTTTGALLGITGDTEYTDELVDFHQGVDLLITEASFGAKPTPESNPYRHMGAADAARLAKEIGAKRLALTHAKSEHREVAVAAARAIFPNCFWPKDGERIVIAE